MARARRTWTNILADVRKLLREETAAASYWADADILLYWNLCQDARAAEMMLAHEGWWKERQTATLVANQKEYLLLEGADRPKRVMIVYTSGSRTVETVLSRNERHDTGFVTDSLGGLVGAAVLPSYRIVGDLLFLEPPPTDVTNRSLVLEYEAAPDRMDGTGSTKMDYRWPAIAESLLILDTAIFALDVENSQGNTAETQGKLEAARRRLEKSWEKVIKTRSYGPSYVRPWSLGG